MGGVEEMRQNTFEQRKHPGFSIPKHSLKHYQTKQCILIKKKLSKDFINIEYDSIVIILKIQYLNDSNSWIFVVEQYQHNSNVKKNNMFDYHKYFKNINNKENIIYSKECLTLNCAAKFFYQHLRYETYQNNAKIVFSQNTKFDSLNVQINDKTTTKQRGDEFFELL